MDQVGDLQLKKETPYQHTHFLINNNHFLWISSKFGQVTLKEGALKYCKIIYGLFHFKVIETSINTPNFRW